MFRNLTKFILFSFVLSGCAGAYFISPTKGPISTITFPSSETKWHFGFSGFGLNLGVKDAKGCGRIIRVKEPIGGERYSTIDIPGNEDILFAAGALSGNSYCNINGIFHSSERGEYKLNYFESKGGCSLSIERKLQNGNFEKVHIENAYSKGTISGVILCDAKEKL